VIKLKLLNFAIVVALSALTLNAHSAEHLDCTVSKYSAKTGKEDSCGTFTFTLPKDNGYGDGKGACEGLQMYISWFIPSPGNEQAELVVIPNKNRTDRGYSSILVDGTFPAHFRNKFMGSDKIVWYADCTVRKQ
jgi:hypothetical protein